MIEDRHYRKLADDAYLVGAGCSVGCLDERG